MTPIPYVTLDVWQANAEGRYDNDDPQRPPAWPAGRPFTLVGPIAPEGTRGNSSEGVDVWGPGTGSAVQPPPGRTPIRPVNPGKD